MKLNTLQQSVVDELDNNLLLIASAGTGKTSTLAYRIANIINSRRAKPEEILCLTFTNRACIEIKEKIMDELEQQGMATEALNVVVKTFHSFCCDIVKLTAKKTSDIFTDFVVFDEEDCKHFIEVLLNCKDDVAREIQKFIKLIKEFIGLLDLYSEDKITNYQKAIEYVYSNEQMRLNNCFKKFSNVRESLYIHGAKVIFAYDCKLNESHGLDFDDLIIYAHEALQNTDIKLYWQEKFKYINIDEVQDTSKLEYKIISQIFGENRLLLCGDPFQTIYEWRGSDPKLVEDNYKRDYNPKIIVLDENYRATQTLLKTTYTYLKNQFHDEVVSIYPDDIKIANPEIGDKIILHEDTTNDGSEEALWIYNQIKDLNLQDISKICILTRSNDYNKNLSRALYDINKADNGDLTFMLIEEYNFFRRQEIKDVIAFMRFAVNKHDGMSLERALKRFCKNIGEATIKNINSEDYRKAGVLLTDFIESSTHKFGDPYEELLQAIELENVVIFDVETTGLDTTTDEIIQIAAIKLNKYFEVKDKFVCYVKPTQSVGRSVNVHKITDEQLANEGRDPRQVFADFEKFSEGALLVGHNVNYDLNILTSQMKRLLMSPIKCSNYYDTLDIFRRFYPNLKNHKLEFLSEFCEVKHKSSHDAYDDICATAEILKFAVENKILPTLDQRKDFIAKYLTKFTDIAKLMNDIHDEVNIMRPHEFMAYIIKTFGIKDYYQQRREEQRVQYLYDFYYLVKNIDNLQLSARDSTQVILQYTTMSSTELFLKNNSKIPIITVHQAKGMEFDYVFIAGVMEEVFPSFWALQENRLEEEKRTFYVAITRAKKKLFLSYKNFRRNQWKKIFRQKISRFINDIPKNAIQRN